MKTTNKDNWIDISQPLNSTVGHWPGDTPFSYEVAFSKEQTGSVNIGKITTSLHTGTHIDAPFHFIDNGPKVLDLDINLFIGPARVIDVSQYEKIDRESLSNFDLEGVTRLLLRTALPNNAEVFPDKIPHLTADSASFLHEKGIRLIGIDAPSVDPLDSKDMETHHALFLHGINILENIMLDSVTPGDYELIALPLPIQEADGSPVRAVIKPI
ncbi:arylformamidase [Metabacillus herbersteinensis]|uniref:Kynurenine formamidase n=1 Tax=Metabacillus herbersteinensis TaxID=283816 RepID=A0ABV6GGX0_9BACI